jgi:hypothetical protein
MHSDTVEEMIDVVSLHFSKSAAEDDDGEEDDDARTNALSRR